MKMTIPLLLTLFLSACSFEAGIDYSQDEVQRGITEVAENDVLPIVPDTDLSPILLPDPQERLEPVIDEWRKPEHPQYVLLFCTPGCQPCRRAKAEWVPWLTRKGWPVQEFEYTDETASLYEEFGVVEGPTWIVLENGVEERRWTGIRRTDMIENMNYVYENQLP